VHAMECDIADRLPSSKDKDPAYKTIWRKEDEAITRNISKKLVKKKWDVKKLCLEVLEEYSNIVNELNFKEKKKLNVLWDVEDAKNVEMIRITNIRYLNLKSSKVKVGMKENVLEKFCEQKGLNEMKESWRKNVEEETELKEIELKEILTKKKLAKSKKKKIELFKECKEMLYKLVTDWKETPTLEEEKMFGIIKEKVKKERMEIALSMKKKKKVLECGNSETARDNMKKESIPERRQPPADDTTYPLM
jgi:hypothetical protein